MSPHVIFSVGFSLFLSGCTNLNALMAPLHEAADDAKIENEYLVLLSPDTKLNLEDRLVHLTQYMKDADMDAEFDILSKYEFKTFAAFLVVATPGAIDALRSHPDVVSVDENSVIPSHDVSWHSEVPLGKCDSQLIGKR